MNEFPSSSSLPWYSDTFNTFAVEWSDEEIVWSVNGIVYFKTNKMTVPGVTLPVPDAQELKLNTAIAWWIDGPPVVEWPQGQDGYTFHYIDWVRMYERS